MPTRYARTGGLNDAGSVRTGRDVAAVAGGDDRPGARRRRVGAPAPRRARVVRAGHPLELRGARRRRRPGRPRAARRRRRRRRPGGDLGAEPRRVGGRAVRHRPGRRHPRQRQPVLPPARAGLRARAGRRLAARLRRGLPRRRLPADGRGRRRAGAARVDRARRGLGGVPCRRGRRRRRGAERARGRARPRRPDQHPVHVGYDRVPEGRDALAPQHPQQRVPRRRGVRVHRRRSHLRAGAVLPLLRHGDGQPRRAHPRGLRGRALGGLRRPRRARGSRRRAVHVAVRRADDVHRDPRPPRPRPLRRHEPAHGHHGRLAVPGRGDAARPGRAPPARGDHLLWHDRDLARLDADAARRPDRQARRHRRRGAPARRGGRRASCAPVATP